MRHRTPRNSARRRTASTIDPLQLRSWYLGAPSSISAAFRSRTLFGAEQVAFHLASKSPRNSSSTFRSMVTIGARSVAILEDLAMWRGLLEP